MKTSFFLFLKTSLKTLLRLVLGVSVVFPLVKGDVYAQEVLILPIKKNLSSVQTSTQIAKIEEASILPIKKPSSLKKKTLSKAVKSSNKTASSKSSSLPKGARVLNFKHANTGARLRIIYRTSRGYDKKEIRKFSRFLKDSRTGAVRNIDPKLLDVLWLAKRRLKSNGTYEVTSGYRSKSTNRKVGGASKSYHVKGKAIDVRLSNRSRTQLRRAAIALGMGGVGTYRGQNIVHLDTGPFRTW